MILMSFKKYLKEIKKLTDEILIPNEEELEMGVYDQIEEKNPDDYEELEKVTTEAVNEFFDGDIKWDKIEGDDE